MLKEDQSLGIRISKDAFCQRLCKVLNRGIVSTSANISGQPSPTSFKEIDPSIKEAVDYVVNLRQDEIMKSPSSIIKIGPKGEVEIIRK